MRKVVSPKYTFLETLNLCIKGMSSDDLQKEFRLIELNLSKSAQDYTKNAKIAELYNEIAFNGKDTDLVFGNINKKQLKNLYTYFLAKEGKPARKVYDTLLKSSDYEICPFCGVGIVSQLDHYLPKSNFPKFSIVPENLVPSCADCNKGKSASFTTLKEKQCLHPYYDHGAFISEQWIFASTTNTVPISVKFEANPPSSWSEVNRKRAITHFKEFKLSKKFAVQAANELATIRGELDICYNSEGVQGVKENLHRKAIGAEALYKNYWKTAMYQALAKCEWYCEGGFLQE